MSEKTGNKSATSLKYVFSWKLFSPDYFVVCFESCAMERLTNSLPGLEKSIITLNTYPPIQRFKDGFWKCSI